MTNLLFYSDIHGVFVTTNKDIHYLEITKAPPNHANV